MNSQFIELVFKNGDRRIVSLGMILAVIPTPDGVSVNIMGEQSPKVVTSPSYDEFRSLLLSDNTEG